MSFDAVWVGSEGHGKVASLVFLLFLLPCRSLVRESSFGSVKQHWGTEDRGRAR